MNKGFLSSKRVLVAPLDWGLGHATRCIPLIHELIRQGFDVFLAGEGKTKSLLQQEFTHVPFLFLPGYQVHYGISGRSLPITLLYQLPKIIQAIRTENRWLHAVVKKHRFDVVISDNRYGLYHPDVHTVFLTHQLRIKTPFPLAEKWLQCLNYHFIKRFSECWVPDHEGTPSLAGSLSHPHKMPNVALTYIGPLSRFFSQALTTLSHKHLLVLLSGPEPQRSLLEKMMLEQLQALPQPVLLVRGLPGATALPVTAPHIKIINHLPAAELEKALNEAWLVIGRCGYSTVMDLVALQKKSILIPTPGQTEQEYLAKHLMQNRLALCLPQAKFNVKAALRLAASFPYQIEILQETKSKLPEIIGRLG